MNYLNGDSLYSAVGGSSLSLTDSDFTSLATSQVGSRGLRSPSKYSGLGEVGSGSMSSYTCGTNSYDVFSSAAKNIFKGGEGVGCGRLMDPDIYTTPTRDTDLHNSSSIRESPLRGTSSRSALRSSPSFRLSSTLPNHDLDSSFSSLSSSIRSSKPPTGTGNYTSPRTTLTGMSDNHATMSRNYDVTSPKTLQTSSLSRSGTPLDGSLSYKSPVRNGPGMSVLDLERALEESEQRRHLLTQKLKDAKETIEMQAKRINEVESFVKENGFEVDDLKYRTREYKRKINNLEKEKGDFQNLRLDSLKVREQLQGRVDTLEFELRTLRSQHERLEGEAKKKQEVIDQLTALMKSLESDNISYAESKENVEKEIAALKESLGIARSRADWLESHSHDNKTELDRLRQENQSLTTENKGMTTKMTSLKNSNQSLKEEAISMVASLQALREDKQRLEKDVEWLQGGICDLKASLAGSTVDKERFFEEKLDLHQKIQSLTHDKERLMEARNSLEDQLGELNAEQDKLQAKVEKKEEEIRSLKAEMSKSKKTNDAVSDELSNVRSKLEKVVGQNSSLEQTKTLAFQQHDLYEQEMRSLESQIDTLKKSYASVRKDAAKEKECMEETVFKIKEDLRHVKEERNEMELRCHELESKLRQTDENLKEQVDEQNKEMSVWKTKVEKLKTDTAKKDSNLQIYQNKLQDLEQEMETLKVSKQSHQQQYEELVQSQEELGRLREDTRRLLQERAENQQVIQLLEMQKNILNKTSEESMGKAKEAEELQEKVQDLEDQKADLEEKLKSVEVVRDDLFKEKEERMASDQLFAAKYGTPDEIMKKMTGLEVKNKGLQDVNNELTEQLAKLEKEHNAAKIRHGEWIPKSEMRKMLAEKETLSEDLQHLKAQYQQLDQRHHNMMTEKFSISHSHQVEGLDVAAQQKEKASLETQISLLTSQLTLLETGKKRAEDRLYSLEKEHEELKKEHKLCSKNSETTTPSQLMGLQQQCSHLEKELHAAQAKHAQQESVIASLKEELEEEKTKRPSRIRQSLDDVGEELTNMRTELHKLLEVIQVKDQAIEDLESRLRDQNQTLQSREKMIEQLKSDPERKPGLSSILRENLKCVEADPKEMSTKLAESEKAKNELEQRVLLLTKELGNVPNGPSTKHGRDDEQSKILSKLQKELRAKDRMIESLEEQLRSATTSEIMKLKRDAGRIDLLRVENRILQARISKPNPSPLAKCVYSTAFTDPSNNDAVSKFNFDDTDSDRHLSDESEPCSSPILPSFSNNSNSKELVRAKEGLFSEDYDDDEENQRNDAEVQQALARLNGSGRDLGSTLKFPSANNVQVDKRSAIPSLNQLRMGRDSLKHVASRDNQTDKDKNPDDEANEIQDSLDRFRIRRKAGLSSLSLGTKFCPKPTRSLVSPDASDSSLSRTLRLAESGYKKDSANSGHPLSSLRTSQDFKKRVTFSEELIILDQDDE